MIVTKFQYPLEKTLVTKLDLMIARCIQPNPKRDAVLLNEGAEGEGKTSLSVAEAFYVAEKTGRSFSHKNVFFDVTKMIKFLQETEGQIAIWDEPALQALSSDALSRVVKDLKRMLMMCRNKRHFVIINMTYFTEFGGYIVWQRPLAMIHVYSRNQLQAGRFIYIKKKNLERLWLDWRSKKQRNYKKYGSKGCRGSFPDVLNPDYKHNVLSEFDFKAYEREKNKAIMQVGEEKKKLSEQDIKRKIIMGLILKNENSPNKKTDKELMEILNISNGGFYKYKRLLSSLQSPQLHINNTLGMEQENLSEEEEVPIID